MKKARPPGFTLTELLVVIAVIAVLAAILFPVFAQACARSRQSVCGSHLQQIARAGLVYLADYDERFPSCFLDPFHPFGIDLPQTLQPYVRNWESFYCPERQTRGSPCLDEDGQVRTDVRCMGYGYNWGSGTGEGGSATKQDGLVRTGTRWGSMIGVFLAEIAQPSRCFFFGDTNDTQLLTLWRDAMPGVRRTTDSAPGRVQTGGRVLLSEPPRHGNGNLFAFVDGHVEWLSFPGGRWSDGGPWVVTDMSMYCRTGRWEAGPIP
jgi:prepilin-type N-terminal cleavage/methylation domain-containing protein/prepilin-type processing-associated H-X9-DG protein